MMLLETIAELDSRLFAELAKADDINEEYLEQQLVKREKLLQELLQQESLQKESGKTLLSATEASELIARSQQLKETAEQLQKKLSEQLKMMNKRRRSMQVYQTVKSN